MQSVAGHVELFCTYAGGLADTPGCHKGRPQAIEGDDRVTGVRWGGCDPPGRGRVLPAETVAPQALLSGLAMENGHIQVDRAQRTNLPGCFAAGDCTGRPYQYAKAAGRGQCGGAQRAGFPGTTAGGTAMKPGWLGYLGRLAGVLAGNALLAYGGGSGLPACRAGGGRRHWRRADPPHVVWAGHCCVRLCAEPGPAGGRMGLHRGGSLPSTQRPGRWPIQCFWGCASVCPPFHCSKPTASRPCVRGLLCGGRRGGYTSGRRFHRRQRLAGHDPAPDNPAAGSGGQNGRRLRRDGHGVLDGWWAQPLVQRDGPWPSRLL